MIKNLKLLLLSLMAAGTLGLGLSACNTTAGLGEDIEHAGSAIKDEAEEKKRY